MPPEERGSGIRSESWGDPQDELQEGEEQGYVGRAWPRAWPRGGAQALDGQVVSADSTAWGLASPETAAKPGVPAIALITWKGTTHSHTWLVPLLPILQLGT